MGVGTSRGRGASLHFCGAGRSPCGLIQALPSWGRRAPALSPKGAIPHPSVCLRQSLLRRRGAPLRPQPSVAPDTRPQLPAPRISTPPPAPASRKLPVLSTAFFGRESCRFAASPKVGVDAAEGYKYGRLPVQCARRGQEERGAAVTGETPHPSRTLRRAPPPARGAGRGRPPPPGWAVRGGALGGVRRSGKAGDPSPIAC